MSKTAPILERGKRTLIGNYARLPVVMARGEGSRLWDADGKEYIDLFAGFGGAILGHCHADLIRAATEQAHKLWHVGNTFWTEPQIELAERLNKFAFKGQAFFCHSGLEANEAACKLARLKGQEGKAAGSNGRWKIISFNKSFHGRSLAMISATGNAAVKAGFGPEVPGFVNVPPGDFAALEAAVDDEVCGILMEPIQGEGGINGYPLDFPAKVRQLCDDRGLTLIFDEVWTGCGRTGKWFGHQYFCKLAGKPAGTEISGPCVVEPDIMTLGKAVGGGLPVGIMFAKPDLAAKLVPGKHGATLGGNPICANVSKTIFDVIERDDLLENASRLGEHAEARLRNEPKIKEKIAEIRGRGLFLGIEMKDVPNKLIEKGLELGVVLNVTAQKVIRLAPPINISANEWDAGLARVIDAIAAV